ncbi:MAG: extensin-like domain-containing protein [Alphaproteobacteria bacterium]
MARRVAYLAVPALVVLSTVLSSCALFSFERRAEWRGDAEQACMAARPFRRDNFIEQLRPIREDLACGMSKPLSVAALNDGTIVVGPTATIGCPMAVALEQWLEGSVQQAAWTRLGSQVVGIHQLSSYACRGRNGVVGADLSEHAFGNALDIASFELADGRVVSVEDDWSRGTQAERDFLREILATACQYFNTVLGPGVEFHYDHFHVDLAHHNAAGTSRYCRPQISVPPMRTADTSGEVIAPLAFADETLAATVIEPAALDAGQAIGDLIGALAR